MMKLKKSLLMAAMLATGVMVLPLGVQAAEAVTIKPVQVASDFIKGADVSMLAEVEKHGGKFYDEKGVQKDAMLILKENGFNYIRLRIWNDPKDAAGNGYGGGNNDLATTIALAKRAKANGMKFLLDFHYSDFWTDPGRQNKPKAWANMNIEQMTVAVHDFTKSTVAEFKKAGVLPDMVQIGNEINGGMLWPEGKSWGQNGGEFDRLAGLLKAGISGVKENLDAKDHVKIMLHLAEGTKNDTFTWWFDEITKRDVQFDVIGLSFYTYWNGPISALKYNMDDISKRYNKDVIVVEAAYGYTTDNCDNAENNFTAKEAADAGYPASVQGQADFLHDLMKSIVEVQGNRGKGIFYWEPAWLPTPGATWATKAGMKYNNDDWKEGNARENQSLFDCQGHVLPSMKVFN
jgi:arabinogalactan endo-1,4-beta-galactosidase